MGPVNVAIIYYSATGTVHALAQAAAEGAEKAGAHTDPIQFRSGNPYGTSHVAGDGPPGEVALQAARHQARRAVGTAASVKAGRAA